MLFNSYIFILLFLPICLIGYFLINKINFKAAQFFLLGMSLWFYGYNNPHYLILISGSIVGNFLISRAMYKEQLFKLKKFILAIGLILNVGLIFYFKYYGFFIWNIDTLFKMDIVIRDIALPLGISFFTFQQISYVVDSYYGKTVDYGFIEYALFVTYFPQLIAGPIVLHSEMIPQFRDESKRKFDSENFIHGFSHFSCGLLKKVLIADTLNKAVEWGFANTVSLSSCDVLLIMLSYTFQIYFDFSGYSDMATGIARMFNFQLPINFDSPYKSLSIKDFWRRWHVTLNRFLTNYVYFPLGGSRKGKVRTYFNLLVVFLVSGIWHGANYTFILWGLMHGVAIVMYRLCSKWYDKIIRPVRWLLTFSFLLPTWLLFRSDGLKEWIGLIHTFVFGTKNVVSKDLLCSFSSVELTSAFDLLNMSEFTAKYPVVYPIVLLLMCFIICLCFKNNYWRKYSTKGVSLFAYSLIFVWCLFSLGSVSVFLYFNF